MLKACLSENAWKRGAVHHGCAAESAGTRGNRSKRSVALVLIWAALSFGCASPSWLPSCYTKRPTIWVNCITGEPETFGSMLDDLAAADIVYCGETHTIDRHHELQTRLLQELHRRGREFALGIEQMEAFNQPALDRYARGEINFETLAAETQWESRWSNYRDYRNVLEAAKDADAPMIALNARKETIRAIARGGGVANLDAATRAELPADMTLVDPAYEKLLNLTMQSHAHIDENKLRPMVEAQIARDEAMAANAAFFLNSAAAQGRLLVVLCGSGHVNYGFGTADRLRRRLPALTDRIVILSESGELEDAIVAMGGREVEIALEDLRALQRPYADYVHIASPD